MADCGRVHFDVPIPPVLRKSGWRAAVYDNEDPETPHVTIRFNTADLWSRQEGDGETFQWKSRRPSKMRMS